MLGRYPGNYGIGPLRFPEGAASPDAVLSQFEWLARFQTHSGDNVPRWLWQDDAMTIPALVEFDPVAVWEDRSGNGHHKTQPDPDKQSVLRFVNGVPVVEGDGFDDFFFCTLLDSDLQTIFLQATAASVANNRILGYQNAARGIFPSSDTWHWFAAFSSSLVPSNVWNTLSLDVQSESLAVWGQDGAPTGATFDPIGQAGGQLRTYWNGVDGVLAAQITSLMIMSQPSASDVLAIATALNSISAPLL